MKLLIDPESLERYIFTEKPAVCIAMIETTKPMNLKIIYYLGSLYDATERPKLIKEMEEFAIKKIKESEGEF